MADDGSTFNVLIVDDSSITRFIVHHVLLESGMSGPGVKIIEAQNGVEGFTAATEGRIDLIFSDMHMPLMSGLEMLERIRERNGAVPPVVLITSERNTELLARAAQLGAVGVVSKPFTNVSLRQIMQKVLAPKQRA